MKLFNFFQDKLGSELKKVALDVEYPFIATLMRMERHGIAIDTQGLEAFKGEVSTRLAELTSTIHKEAGSEFNINSTKQLGAILFDTLGCTYRRN